MVRARIKRRRAESALVRSGPRRGDGVEAIDLGLGEDAMVRAGGGGDATARRWMDVSEVPVPDLPSLVPARAPGGRAAAGVLVRDVPGGASEEDAGVVACAQPGLLRGAASESSCVEGVAASGATSAAAASAAPAGPTPLGRRARPVRGARRGLPWDLRQSPPGCRARPEAHPSGG